MEFDFARLLTTTYFFDRAPGGDFLLGYLLLAFFVLALFSKSIILKFAPDNKYFRKSAKKKFGKFVALGISGLILVAARFSGIPVFSMRVWLYIVLFLTIGFGIWTAMCIRAEYLKRMNAVKREMGKRSQ